MHSTLHLLTSVYLILSLSAPTLAIPAPSPEQRGAAGTCSDPVISITSATKLKQGPYLVSGARSDANPNGAEQQNRLGSIGLGEASFSNQWSVQTTIQVGGSLEGSADWEKVATLGLGLTPSVSISWSTGRATTVNTICPSNTGSGTNDTVTWGLQYYQYSYSLTGTKSYGGYYVLDNDCDSDQINNAGKTLPWNGIFPAKQAGAMNDAQGEIEFQCCTDTESDPWPGSPVCPAAS